MNIIPLPRRVDTTATGSCRLDAKSAVVSTSDKADRAVRWLTREVDRLAGISLATVGSDGATTITFSVADVEVRDLTTGGRRADAQAPDVERHRIVIDENGIEITAPTAEGLFRGAATVVQLIATSVENGVANVATATIDDAPTYAWRGLNVDVVRSFHNLDAIKRVIDLIALYKFNVLHLHLTDSEGWRFPIDGYPELIEKSSQGACGDRPGGAYTRQDYDELLRYAADHFLTVVPEFDSPGHTASMIHAYPHLAPMEIRELDRAMQYVDHDTPGVLEIIEAVLSQLARAHPGAAIHIGGDEAIAMPPERYLEFMERVMPLARSTGKTIVAWQEAARGSLQPGDILQHWVSPKLVRRFQESLANPTPEQRAEIEANPVHKGFLELFVTADQDLAKGVAQGADVILSQSDLLYLDTEYPEPSLDPAQEPLRERLGLRVTVYENGTTKDSYDWMPTRLQDDLPDDRIVGVEAHIWGETIEESDDMFFLLLPRLPGVADKAWSDERSWDEYRPVVASHARLWESMGLPYFKSSVVFE